jgi:hypothetical protein
MNPADPTPLPLPEDAAAAAARAKEASRLMALKMVVITLGVILVALLVVVLSTLAIRAFRGPRTDAAVTPLPVLPGEARPGRPPVQATLPPGYRLVSTSLGDGRLAVTAEGPDGALIVLFDARTMAEVGRIRLSPER